jgi:HK97 family phage major capsid protein
MKTVIELREIRAGKNQALESLVSKADAEKRDLTADEQATFDNIYNEIEALDADIQRAQKVEAMRAKDAAASRKPEEVRIKEAFSLGTAVKELARGRSLTGAEAEVHQEGLRECTTAGVSADDRGIILPGLFTEYGKRTDFNVGTPADGGNTVATIKSGMVEPLRPESVIVANGARVLSGLVGDLEFNPIAKGSIAWESEVSAADAYYGAISSIKLQPKRAGAFLTISDKLLRQSAYTIQSFLTGELNRTLGQGLDEAFIQGGGSNEPTGILANAGTQVLFAGAASGSGVNADGAALTWGDLKNLWTAVASENGVGNNAYWLTNAKVIGSAMETPRQGSGVEGNFIINESRNVMGYRFVDTMNVPSNLEKGASGTTLSALIFNGKPETQLVGQWGGTQILVDPYTGAGTAQLKIYVWTWVDTALLQPKAFAAIKDLIA